MRILLFLLLALGSGAAWAQGVNSNWRFSTLTGLAFEPTGPALVASKCAMFSESASTISDAQGRLLFYTNGETIWNRDNVPMTDASGRVAVLNGHFSSAQGALIVKLPGSSSRYYVFTTDARERNLAAGLCYTEVDMALNGGLGGVTALGNVPLPVSAHQIMEGVAGLQHANRRDVWVLVHSASSNTFDSFLVTAAGVSPVPVASLGGPVGFNTGSALAIVKFAPDGRHLARTGVVNSRIELFDFDPATGQVSNEQVLDVVADAMAHDLEYSPDGSQLYLMAQPLSNPRSTDVWQYDLRAGSLAASRASRQLVGHLADYANLEIGPDGRLYTSAVPNVGVLDRPNRRGSASRFRADGIINPGIRFGMAVQNIVRLQPPQLDFMAETACAGETVSFEPYDQAAGPYTWIFHDPHTGATDSLPGPVVTRTFPLPGSYPVTLSTVRNGQYYRQARLLLISPLPPLELPDTVALCHGPVRLQLPAQLPGTTVRWSDGSGSQELLVSAPGTYRVWARNNLGCERTRTVVAIACDVPNVITPNGDGLNETFRIVGSPAADWQLEVYNRWGRQIFRQAAYDNRWSAQQQSAGIYYYLLVNQRTGQRLRGWLEVVK